MPAVWFRYSGKFPFIVWWPCHWKGVAYIFGAMIVCLAVGVATIQIVGIERGALSLVTAVIASIPFQWVGFKHSKRYVE